jgi:hypothetical protein
MREYQILHQRHFDFCKKQQLRRYNISDREAIWSLHMPKLPLNLPKLTFEAKKIQLFSKKSKNTHSAY